MYQSIMWKYMGEEAILLKQLMEDSEVSEKASAFQNMQALYIVAHGSSYNAANAVAPMLSKLCHVRVYVYTPSNFIHNAHSLNWEDKAHTWICGISQTGTSRSVLEAVTRARNDGFSLLGITNTVDSPMEQISDVCCHLQCGEEDSNAKTKGYSSTLVLLWKLTLALAKGKNCITEEECAAIKAELFEQIEYLPQLQKQTREWCEQHHYGEHMEHLYVIGNGCNFATAMEGMLKLMETMCIPTMFSDIEEFSHGMHRSVKPESYVILLHDGLNAELMDKTFAYLNNKGCHTLMLNGADSKGSKEVIAWNPFPKTSSVLLFTAVIQVISAFVPEARDMDPNRNANDDYTECMNTRV